MHKAGNRNEGHIMLRIFYICILLFPICVLAQTRPANNVKIVVLKVPQGAATATTRLSITNVGADAIKITRMDVGPVGITAELGTKDIASHTSGILTITADASKFESVAGEVRGGVRLIEDNTHRSIPIIVEVLLPEVVEASTHSLFWAFGESDAAKTVDIRMAKNVEGKIVQIKVDSDGNGLISCQQTRNEDGSYTLSIRPPTTEVGFGGVLFVSVTADVTVNGKPVLKTQEVQIEVGARGTLATRPSAK